MSDLLNNSFIMSHSQTGGYDYDGNISNLIPETNIQKWVLSYISMLSEYASNPNYISQPVTTKSYFVKDDYVIFLESYPRMDNRLFLEKKVTINSRKSELDLKKFYGLPNSTEICIDEGFVSKVRDLLLCSFLSDNTTIFFLTNGSECVDLIRDIVSFFSDQILKCNSCIEVLEKLPAVKTSAVICRCIYPRDKNEFLSEIESKSNYIVVDMTTSDFSIDISLYTPTYAQRAYLYLLNFYDFDNIYYSIIEKLDSFKVSIVDKVNYFNTILYLTALDNFYDRIYEISMSAREKTDINLMLNRGEKI